jgi:PKD repeat protein
MPTVAVNTVEYCQNENAVALSATASAGNTLNWYTQATGGVASTSAPVPSTSTPGTFNYYVSQSNAAGDQSMRALVTVTVNATPATPTVSANGPTSFCTGGSVVLTSSQASGNVWSNTATTAAITVSASGTFSVTYTDNNGCSATSSATTVNVSNAPVPTINATATAACSGDSIVLTSSTADAYLWSNNATTQSITVTSAGNYTVTTTNADACDGVGTSAATAITFGTTPTANATFTVSGNVVTFTNTSTDATSYSWDFDDFSGSSAASPVHAFAANGSYDVVLTAINGNCTSTFTITISISVGLEELTGITEVVLFPNPSNGEAVLTFTAETNETAQTMIIDQLGKVVSTSSIEVKNGMNTFAINAEQLGNGMYTLLLNTGRGSIVRKMIVQK